MACLMDAGARVADRGYIAVPRRTLARMQRACANRLPARSLLSFFLLAILSSCSSCVQSLAAQDAAIAKANYFEPPRPEPSTTVQELLDVAEELRRERDYGGGLKQADVTLASAQEIHDAAGEACAHRERAILLQHLRRVDDAILEWRQAAQAWQRADDGPGRIEALGRAGVLLLPINAGEGEAALGQALRLAQDESRRPLEAAEQLAAVQQFVFNQGNLEWVRKLTRAVFEITDRVAPDSLSVAMGLNSLGRVALAGGDAKAAADDHRRALAIQEKIAPDSLDVALSLNNLGLVAYNRGDLKAAADYYGQAFAIRERLAPHSLDVADGLHNLGNVAEKQGDLKAAWDYYGRALVIRQKLAPDSIEEAQSLNGLGNVAWDQGKLDLAAAYHRRALAIRQAVAPGSPYVAASLNNLAIVADSQGDLKTAAEYLQRTVGIYEKLAPDSMSMAISQDNLGLLDAERGDLKAAIEYLRRALAIYENLAPESLDMAANLTNLGDVAIGRGDLKSARDYYRRALAIRQKWAPNSLSVAEALDAMGIVAIRQGNLKAAAEGYKRALAIQQRLAPHSLVLANSLWGLGKVADDRGSPKVAAEYFRLALATREKLAPDSLALAGILDSLAIAAREMGDLDSAETSAARAWRIAQRQVEAVSSDEARQAFGSSVQTYSRVLLSIQVERGEPEAAFVTLEEARAQALAQLLFERPALLNQASGDLWPRHQEALAKLHHAEEAVNQAEAQPGGSREAEQQKRNARQAYQQARYDVDGMWSEIQKRKPRAFNPALTLAEAARTLGEKTAFVAFAINDDEAYALAVGGGRNGRRLEERVQLVAPARRTTTAKLQAAKLLENRILGFWDLSHTPPDASAASQAESRALVLAGRELFDALFPGEIGKLVRESKRLILSPDGPLWQLPFAALVTGVEAGGRPRYLGESVTIAYTPSLALYARLRKEGRNLQKGQRPEVLAVGDPDFDRTVKLDPADPEADRVWAGLQPPGVRPERLRETAREAQVVAELYGGNALTGDQATEAELRKRIETADVIHLATHGSLETALPMSSGIMLTPPESEPAIGETDNDGALQAWEIFSQLKLRAELVVLSACDTARGEVVKGEGVVGLMRALEYAGARSIVATQWSVASGESTTRLMEEFHKDLRKGEAKDEALKDAMAAVRKEHPHPFYWAPFILLGDPDNPNLGDADLEAFR